jgi:hypothetical protein
MDGYTTEVLTSQSDNSVGERETSALLVPVLVRSSTVPVVAAVVLVTRHLDRGIDCEIQKIL